MFKIKNIAIKNYNDIYDIIAQIYKFNALSVMIKRLGKIGKSIPIRSAYRY